MSADETTPDGSGAARFSGRSQRGVDLTVSVNRETVMAFVEEVRQVVREVVREELSTQRQKVSVEPESVGRDAPPESAKRGIDLPPGESLKARDLRTALLLGKLPEHAGLLIDADTTSQLMGISQRTLHRLIAEKAIPEPVRISGRLLRWRLAELLEWIEAGCPHRKYWTYGAMQSRSGKQRK